MEGGVVRRQDGKVTRVQSFKKKNKTRMVLEGKHGREGNTSNSNAFAFQ